MKFTFAYQKTFILGDFCAFFVHFFKLIWAQKNGSVKLIYLTTCPAKNVTF